MDLKFTDIAAMTQAGLNLIQQALSIYDDDLRLVVGNSTFQTMFGLPDRLLTRGARFDETIRFLAENGEYGVIEDVEAFVTLRVGQAKAFEPHYMERSRSNGRCISVEGSPLPQGGWVTVYTDITGIRRQEMLLRARSAELSEQLLSHAEELSATNRALAATNSALEEAKRQLTEMESRARVTAEMMPAHIARVGRDLRYTYSNRRLSSVLPGSPVNIVGLHGREALGDEAFDRISPYLESALVGEASVFEFAHEGTGRRIRVAFNPDIDEVDEVSGVYILSMDVTREAQARAALTHTRKRELAASLTSGLAHDFSNLLTIILGMQARLAQMELSDDAQELIAATSGAARRGGALLGRIGAMSGRPEIRPEPVDLAFLMAGLEVMARAALPEKIALIIHLPMIEGPVLLDIGAMHDALLNLVLNARDAIGADGGTITISVEVTGEEWLNFTVRDTGPGFSEEALEHALDTFFTTKGAAGSGLGLSMVYDHAKLSGGRVKIANGPQGAVVTMRLPLRRSGGLGTARLVLLVEDQAEIREDVRDMLMALGHQVIEAENGAEALALASIDGIALVLSDIMLGDGLTGDRLVVALGEAGLACPKLLMSSLPADDGRRLGLPVLTKPFSQGQLAAFLAEELSE